MEQSNGQDIDAEVARIAGLPESERRELVNKLSRVTGAQLDVLRVKLRLAVRERHQRDEEFANLHLRRYVEECRPDIVGRDDGKGGLVILCPINAGEEIVVCNASLIGSRAIVKRLAEGGYTPSSVEYVKALAPDDLSKVKTFCIDTGEAELLATQLENDPGFARALGVKALRSINRVALKDQGSERLAVALELNERFAKVDQNGQIVIFDLDTYQSYVPEEFHKKLSAERVMLTVGDKTKSLAKSRIWFDHPAHLQYDGVGFYPEGRDANGRRIDTDERRILNLWRTFSGKPRKGDWSLLRKHLRDVICAGNEEHFQYVLKWLAHMFQRPWEKPGVAIVAKGLKRTGKGTAADMIREALGEHLARMYTHQEHVIGRFAGESTPKLFKQIEEAVFAKDGRVQGPLKSKITDLTETVEQKFKTPVEVASFTRWWFNTNAKAPVPATWDEERYLILEVSEAHRNDHAYFARIRKQMLQEGGLEAMVHDLKNLDIKKFNVREVPYSKAKGGVVREMLDRDMKGVLDIVVRGEVPAAKSVEGLLAYEPKPLNAEAVTYVDKAHLYAVLEPHFREHGSPKSLQTAVGMFMRESGLVSGDVRADRSMTHRPQFVVRPLNDVRAEWSKQYGLDLSDLGHGDDAVPDDKVLADASAKLAEVKRALGSHPAAAEIIKLHDAVEAAVKRGRGENVVPIRQPGAA